MMKFLIFFIIIIGLLSLWRQRRKTPYSTPQPQTVTLVQCAYCHIYLPDTEALSKNGHYWCSTEHQQQGQASS